MISFREETRLAAQRLIELAFEEDLQDVGDLTSQATIPGEQQGSVAIVARDDGRLSGGVLIRLVYEALATRYPGNVAVEDLLPDGSALESGTVIARLNGPVSALLTGERTALNFLIHMSGIASLTSQFVQNAGNTGVAILDTRKTLPGYRRLQKYAVLCGGGVNHRMGLYDGMLIKDNHLAACGGSVARAVEQARTFLREEGRGEIPVEVEVDTLDQLRDALTAHPEIVLLDNMRPAELQSAVSIRNELSPETQLEASGGVNLQTIGCIAGSGVDRVSIGGLTHSAVALDIGYDWQTR